MNFKVLLLIHSVLTFSTFVLLLVAPTSIPDAFGIKITQSQFLFPYLIGGNDLALAYISWAGRSIKEISTQRILARFIMLFHGSFGTFCIYVLIQGAHLNLIGNIIFRFVTVGIFYYYGIYRNKEAIYHV